MASTHRVSRLILLAFTLAAPPIGASPQSPDTQASARGRRAITEKDLFAFNWIGDPQVSPDGSRVAFTRVVVDAKRTGYETSIWTVATAGGLPPVRMTSGKHDMQPRWSPDGRYLAFVRGGERAEDGKAAPAQIALLALAGGEAVGLTDLPRGAANPVWSPDGSRLAFLSRTTQADLDEQAAARKSPGDSKLQADQPDSEHESDVHVITRAVYRSNDAGYLDSTRHTHIWIVDVPRVVTSPVKARPLTSGNFDEAEPVWTPDGLRVLFLTTRVEEPYYELPTTDLFAVRPAGGDLERIATVPMGIGDLAVSPDGSRVAFHGSVPRPVRSYSQPDLWVMGLASSAEPRNLTATFDSDMGATVGGDNAAPRGGGGPPLRWSADGRYLFDVITRDGRSPLVRVDTQSGAVSEVTRGDEAVLNFSMSPDARTVVALVSSPVRIGDLFQVDERGGRRLTDINGDLWSKLNLTAPEEFIYTTFDGRRIQSWIQKPPDFDPGKKYPLILNIHGGPHTAYGWVFDHEFQWMAAKGYVVLYPNPRGSTGYGQEFGNIIQYHYPGDDFRDLMAGVDQLLARGYIDEKRLGVTGGSGGGVLTNWTVTHTDRFAAAVSQRDISNWASWWYTADFTLFQPTWFKAPPFQDPEDYANRSAITFVENIHTPIMFVLGQNDYRTPPDSGGEQLFRALKFLKRPTAMVIFPRETHELSRSGEPWHRIERLQHIVGWFDKWMMGVPHPEYDVTPGKQVTPPRK